MQRVWEKEGQYWSESEWFLALITEVGTTTAPPPGACSASIPYAWQALDYCPSGSSTEVVGTSDLSGDMVNRTAYCIDENVTVEVGAKVLMRQRGTFNGLQVYEFVASSSGGGGAPTDCPRVTSVQCTGNTLLVVYNDRCVINPSTTTTTTTTSTTTTTTAAPISNNIRFDGSSVSWV